MDENNFFIVVVSISIIAVIMIGSLFKKDEKDKKPLLSDLSRWSCEDIGITHMYNEKGRCKLCGNITNIRNIGKN